ncbi:MAG: hypothetical protein ACFFG0_11130, partial [Candidatus Thorarchaeota archaeon]
LNKEEILSKIRNIDSKIQELSNKRNKLNNLITNQKNIPSKLSNIDSEINILQKRISLNEEKNKWDLKLNENSDILKEVREELIKQKNKINIKKLDYENKKKDFQKADKFAFNIYRQLENVEDNLEKVEKNITDLKKIKQEYQNRKNEIDRKSIQTTLNLEQENVKLNTFNQEIEKKRRDFERINSEIGPLISKQIIVIRPIEFINEDISKIDKQLLSYLDVDDSLLVEKDQIIASLKEINRNQIDLERDIKTAIKTEGKLEKTYYNKFRGVLENLQSKVNQKFEDSQIKSYCSLELTGKFEDLGVNIRAAISKDQLKSFTALSGGQVSLISICLILSLQEIKPSPLCMFDEAGMFLDEKNSEVAYQLIKYTLEQNPIQILMFLPKSSSSLFLLADKIIGIARAGKNEISSVFKPKIIKKK